MRKLVYVILLPALALLSTGIQAENVNVRSQALPCDEIEYRTLPKKPGENPRKLIHCAYEPRARATGKLVLFLIGTNTNPKDFYSEFAKYAADQGYHVLVLNYPNRASTIHCRPKDFTAFRELLIRGGNASEIACRAAKLPPDLTNNINKDNNAIIPAALEALKDRRNKSAGGWRDFISDGGALQWRNIILAGHSQGSGHAAYIARHIASVHKVILFSGPPDCDNSKPTPEESSNIHKWMAKCDAPIPWLVRGADGTDRSRTDPERFYAVYAGHDNITRLQAVQKNICRLKTDSYICENADRRAQYLTGHEYAFDLQSGLLPLPGSRYQLLKLSTRSRESPDFRAKVPDCLNRIFFDVEQANIDCDTPLRFQIYFEHNAAIVNTEWLHKDSRKYITTENRNKLWGYLLNSEIPNRGPGGSTMETTIDTIVKTISYITWDIMIIGVITILVIRLGIILAFPNVGLLLREIWPLASSDRLGGEESPVDANQETVANKSGSFGFWLTGIATKLFPREGFFNKTIQSKIVLLVLLFWAGAIVDSWSNVWIDQRGIPQGWTNDIIRLGTPTTDVANLKDKEHYESRQTDDQLKVDAFFRIYSKDMYAGKSFQERMKKKLNSNKPSVKPVAEFPDNYKPTVQEVLNLYYEARNHTETNRELKSELETLRTKIIISRVWSLLSFFLFVCMLVGLITRTVQEIRDWHYKRKGNNNTTIRPSVLPLLTMLIISAGLYLIGYKSWQEYSMDVHLKVIGHYKISKAHKDPLSERLK